MEIIKPEQKGFTVYSKSGCPNCMSVKHFIKENKLFYTEINCDEYIFENKDEFLTFIENIYLIHLDKKQNTQTSITNYLRTKSEKNDLIKKINLIKKEQFEIHTMKKTNSVIKNNIINLAQKKNIKQIMKN